MRVSVYGIYLIIDGDIGKTMDEESNESFKKADKVSWILKLVHTVLLIIVCSCTVVSIANWTYVTN